MVYAPCPCRRTLLPQRAHFSTTRSSLSKRFVPLVLEGLHLARTEGRATIATVAAVTPVGRIQQKASGALCEYRPPIDVAIQASLKLLHLCIQRMHKARVRAV